MASVLHGSARTTPCFRAEFQAPQEGTRSLVAVAITDGVITNGGKNTHSPSDINR